MPPLALLLLALLGLLRAARKKRGGLALATLAVLTLWLLSCHGTAVWLGRHALPQFAATSAAQLQSGKVQAIVILGGGLLPAAPEYGGQPQPSPSSAARLRYGIWLARQSSLPVAFTGGTGWAADGMQPASEAEVAGQVALQDYGVTLRWQESASRDTAGNARLLAPLLLQEGVQRIGLVVTPAPTGFVLPVESGFLQWLPSPRGLLVSQQILRECLGLAVSRFMPV